MKRTDKINYQGNKDRAIQIANFMKKVALRIKNETIDDREIKFQRITKGEPKEQLKHYVQWFIENKLSKMSDNELKYIAKLSKNHEHEGESDVVGWLKEVLTVEPVEIEKQRQEKQENEKKKTEPKPLTFDMLQVEDEPEEDQSSESKNDDCDECEEFEDEPEPEDDEEEDDIGHGNKYYYVKMVWEEDGIEKWDLANGKEPMTYERAKEESKKVGKQWRERADTKEQANMFRTAYPITLNQFELLQKKENENKPDKSSKDANEYQKAFIGLPLYFNDEYAGEILKCSIKKDEEMLNFIYEINSGDIKKVSAFNDDIKISDDYVIIS